MVDGRNSIVQMGSGDVGVACSATGTEKEPKGIVVFYNHPDTTARILPDDYSIVDADVSTMYLTPDQAISLVFTSSDSIDSVISVLNAVKKNLFGDKATRKLLLSKTKTKRKRK